MVISISSNYINQFQTLFFRFMSILFQSCKAISNTIFQIYVNSLTFIFNSLLPLTTMSIMNYVVYRTIHHRHLDDSESLSGGRRHFVSSRSYRERSQRNSTAGCLVNQFNKNGVFENFDLEVYKTLRYLMNN